ncbi:helix-loop-helix DNA-binding domain-containing transcription factor [Phycomyces blakesleeanus]|uniref:Helix-loop-helix DNA-binding domain-containing transcription factor n=2 Tax=Phycomyces blakesleeanus TaxID=4837 RepID=A0A162NK89_PHYB8|nr:helix-loop-helix DNA-binding domain-containing transcription factor [Phycomyces blakesleeanus NRRL 1555(-)]OAD70454.1 helix-loop-helix DNA-binding domain-containing transcription factor [Phycomyces blakesleeanus NRRL 1555(-)]|eukprot:XP_018288494.1 helix-loop-helix DNA-binding domain-containing transcription factor [Phycomyces blakesleeanus NRRL 1555(-)]
MPSDKKKTSNSGKSAQHTISDFIGAFAVTPSHPFGISFSSNMSPVEESDIANSDKRSAHNALERQRREGLNTKYQQLAHALPSLQTVRRPSKTMIITRSLEYVSTSVQRESTYQKQLRILREENEKLRKQAHRSSAFLKKKLHLDSFQTKKSPENIATTSTVSGNSIGAGSKKISSPVSPTPSARVVKKKSSRSFLKKFTSKLHPQMRPKQKVKFEQEQKQERDREQTKRSPGTQQQAFQEEGSGSGSVPVPVPMPIPAPVPVPVPAQIKAPTPMPVVDTNTVATLLATQTPLSSPSYLSSSTISPLPPHPLPPLFSAPYLSAHSPYPLSVNPALMPQLDDTLSPLEQVWLTDNLAGQSAMYSFDQTNMNTTDSYFMDSQMVQMPQNMCGAGGLHQPTHTPLNQTPSTQYPEAIDYNNLESYYYFGVPSTDPLFNMPLPVTSAEMSLITSYIEQEDMSPIFMQNMSSNGYPYI